MLVYINVILSGRQLASLTTLLSTSTLPKVLLDHYSRQDLATSPLPSRALCLSHSSLHLSTSSSSTSTSTLWSSPYGDSQFIGMVIGLADFCRATIPARGFPRPNIRGTFNLWLREWHPLHIFEVNRETTWTPWNNSRGALVAGKENVNSNWYMKNILANGGSIERHKHTHTHQHVHVLAFIHTDNKGDCMLRFIFMHGILSLYIIILTHINSQQSNLCKY